MPIHQDCFHSIDTQFLIQAAGWQARYRIIMDWSKYVAVKPPLRIERYSVPGCDAAVWLAYRVEDSGRYSFFFDSDSRIIKGLVAIILAYVHDKTREEIDFLSLEKIIEQAGLERHLSASRANGFARILRRIKECVDAACAVDNVSRLDSPS